MGIFSNRSCWLLAFFILPFCGYGKAMAQSTNQLKESEICQYWYSQVDPSVKRPESIKSIDGKVDDNTFKGIECLLKLQGQKGPAKFGGATRHDVSQIFEAPSVEVAALYYISFLYYQKWDHANAVALTDINTGEIIKADKVAEVYSYYREWFKQVKKVGIAKARSKGLDPLTGRKIAWY
jgi:hypothetical protein